MKYICMQVGPVRIRIWRFLRGGLCPLNVPGKKWTIIPQLSEPDEKRGTPQNDWSPSGLASALLSALVKFFTPEGS